MIYISISVCTEVHWLKLEILSQFFSEMTAVSILILQLGTLDSKLCEYLKKKKKGFITNRRGFEWIFIR